MCMVGNQGWVWVDYKNFMEGICDHCSIFKVKEILGSVNQHLLTASDILKQTFKLVPISAKTGPRA